MSNEIVIAGGGLAAQRCAETLRRLGYDGRLRVVCAETRPPYDRPPLSKAVLSGECSAASLSYKPAEWYESHDVDLLLGTRAVSLSLAQRCLGLSDGSALRYDRLLIATGSRPRTLPALDRFENVSVLRDIDDALRLREVLRGVPRLAVIGAGFVGQEVAATARMLGAEVTMIEAAAAPLDRLLGSELAGWFSALHRDAGVEVLTSATIESARGAADVEELELSTGRRLEVDHVVVGIGVQPEVQWLHGSGLDCDGGVPVDEHGATTIADVFVAGDCAASYDARVGRHIPGSHWEAAARQGARVARGMLGLEPGIPPVTSFWTDQYGIRINYVGHAPLADTMTIDGELAAHDFAATFAHNGTPVAVLLAGRPRALPAARKLIENGAADELSNRN